jgi:hypothetical protein
MKILFLTTKGFDYVQDLTYSGLVDLLGATSVVDFPWHSKFHLPLWRYPKNLGFHNSFSLPRILPSNFKIFDAVIVGACKKDVFESYLAIQKRIPSHVPVIFLDGGDSGNIAGDLEREASGPLFPMAEAYRPFDLILKREVLLAQSYGERVVSFPMCVRASSYARFSAEVRSFFRYDVSFWAVESHPVRSKALEMLEPLFDCESNGTVRGQSFRKYTRKGDAYLRALTECRLVLNFRGAGWDTLRYWECPALGAFLLSQKPKIVIEQPFVDGESIVYVQNDLSDLIDKCEYYLQNDSARERIARASFTHVMTHHRTTHRASKILEFIKNFTKYESIAIP